MDTDQATTTAPPRTQAHTGEAGDRRHSPSPTGSLDGGMSRLKGGLSWWQAAGAGAVVATAANLAVVGIASVADASFDYVDGDKAGSINAGDVAFMSAVPLAVGVALTALVALRWFGVFRVAQVVGAVLALGTIWGAVDLDTDNGTRVALSVTHVVVAAAVVAALEAVRRHRLVHKRSPR